MTDEERNAKIESIKQNVLARIFGEEVASKAVEVPEVEFRTTDKNWYAGKTWMDQLRITNPMNSDTRSLGEYNKMFHDNNGVIVTVSNEKMGMAIDPIK